MMCKNISTGCSDNLHVKVQFGPDVIKTSIDEVKTTINEVNDNFLLENEYEKLMIRMKKMLNATADCGNQGQQRINDEYQILVEFCEKNPSFKLIERPTVITDGQYGLGFGFGCDSSFIAGFAKYK